MLKAKDIMTRKVHSVTPDTDVEELSRLFVETGVSSVPVVEEDGRLYGIVTETDLVEQDKPLHIPTVVSIFDWVFYLESEKDFREEVQKITARKVRNICTREIATCKPDTPVNEIAALMVENRIHLIPVMENDRMVGVVARLDIIRSMGQ